MAIPDKNINFRAPNETHMKLQDLMRIFERDRSWLLRKAVDVLWTIMFDIGKLQDFFHEWQVFLSKNGQQAATQLSLQFPKADGYNWMPKIFPAQKEVA